MSPERYAITFACYNQVEYTRQCVDSLLRHGADPSRIVIVDNASKDDTRAYLDTLPLPSENRIYNKSNLACGAAWNQGAMVLQAEWTIVMNNDVIVSEGWLDNLINTAERKGLKIISPALIEGPLDYDFDGFAATASAKMADAVRLGARHAVCLAIHESVWQDVGYFRATPKLLGYEDTVFFHEAEQAGIPCGMTGASWLHHFGSITVTALKQEQGLSKGQGLGNRRNYRLLQQSWLERKLAKLGRLRQVERWRKEELAQYGLTMHGERLDGNFIWAR